jgi:hypothetical protein
MLVGMLRIYSLCILLIACCWRSDARAASNDSTGVRASKDLGLYIGGAYSLAQMDASSYFVEDFYGKSELKNAPGMFAGFCYNFYVGKRSIIRPAIEAVFIPTSIAYYRTDIKYKREQKIFPATVEFPISWIYSGYRTKVFPRPKAKPEFGLSLRPVLTIKALNDAQPVMRTSNLNTDVFIGYPLANHKSVMRLEVFYSHGWFNLIGEDSSYQTYSISRLVRNTAGIRFIFH